VDDEDSSIAADNDGIIPKNSAKKTAMEEGAEGEDNNTRRMVGLTLSRAPRII